MCLLLRNATEIERSWSPPCNSFLYTLGFLISTRRNVNVSHLSMNVIAHSLWIFCLLPVLSLVSAVLWTWSDSVWSQESDQSIINIKTNVVIILMLIYLAWISHQHSVLTLFLLSYDSNILLTVIPSIVFHQAEIIMLTKSKWLCAHIINPVITFIKVVAIIHK